MRVYYSTNCEEEFPCFSFSKYKQKFAYEVTEVEEGKGIDLLKREREREQVLHLKSFYLISKGRDFRGSLGG